MLAAVEVIGLIAMGEDEMGTLGSLARCDKGEGTLGSFATEGKEDDGNGCSGVAN